MTRGKDIHGAVAAGALVGLRPPDAPAATARPSPDHPTLHLPTTGGGLEQPMRGGIFSVSEGGKFGGLLTSRSALPEDVVLGERMGRSRPKNSPEAAGR
jgi:hypothetical protein